MKYLKNYISRDYSCLTGENKFRSIAKIEKFPVFFGVTNKNSEEDIYAEMEWFIEDETGLIQLNKLIPLDVLYQEQHAYGFGKTWESHYQQFSEYLLDKSPLNVLEIGAGQGRIAQICTQSNKIDKWTIIEPNPTFEETEKIKIIKGFFDDKFILKDKFDTYSFSHVLEHAYDPRTFLKHIYEKMKKGDNLIFSYPNLKCWLNKKFTNSLNFEHTIFLTDTHLLTLLEDIGFKILDVKDYEEHSHFFHVQKNDKIYKKVNFKNLAVEHEKLLTDFINYHYDEVNKIKDNISNYNNPEVFLFGAHIFSQYLTVFGLETKNIISILDNSIQKQGKRLYGTNLFAESPSVLKNYSNPIVILRAGPYNEEIKHDIINNINSKTKFI
jgi:2-polyprenyl-3-methyl-5-hydroxy-6-metoxy-1,4-benzoquinol methylase